MCCKVSNYLAVYKYNKVFFYRKRLRSVTLGSGYFVTKAKVYCHEQYTLFNMYGRNDYF